MGSIMSKEASGDMGSSRGYGRAALVCFLFLLLVLGFFGGSRTYSSNPLVKTPPKSVSERHIQIAALLTKKSEQARDMYRRALVEADDFEHKSAALFQSLKQRMADAAPKEELRAMAEEVRRIEAEEKAARRHSCLMLYQSRKFEMQAKQEVIKGNQKKLSSSAADDERQYAMYLIDQAEAALAHMSPLPENSEQACPES